MGRPLRFPCQAKLVDLARWPHAVEIDRRHVRYNARHHDVIGAEVEVWLRANVRRGGWRFSQRLSIIGKPTTEDPCHIIASIGTVFRIHLASENDAFAFKMRWL